MKESDIDVKALSNAYKEKKKMREDFNVVKIGRMSGLLLFFILLMVAQFFLAPKSYVREKDCSKQELNHPSTLFSVINGGDCTSSALRCP